MDENTANTPQEDPAQATGVTLMRPTIVAALYLLNIFLGFSVFVGIVLAYVWRNDSARQQWEKTHFTYLIRTFWIGLAMMLVFFVAWFAAIFGIAFQNAGDGQPPSPAMFLTMFSGMGLFLLTAVWFCIRCILSLVKTGERKAMPKPETWLF